MAACMRESSLAAVDRLIEAVAVFRAEHGRPPAMRDVVGAARLGTTRTGFRILGLAREMGCVDGSGPTMQVTDVGRARLDAMAARHVAAAALINASHDALAETRRVRDGVRAQLEARLELHAKLRDEHDAEVARLDEALRHLEEDEP